MFYFQSIIHDLNKIKDNEVVIEISKEEIRQTVEEINWKINVERSSILGDAEDVG